MIQELVTENPMLIELRRGYRRFFGISRFGAMNAAILTISVLIYGLVLLVSASNRNSIEPYYVMHFQTFVYFFLVPSLMHGAIAGERERRTWEMLAVAPITNAQIVIGKFITGAVTVFVIALLMVPPLLFSLSGAYDATWQGLLRMEVVSIGYALMMTAVAIFISSRTQRAMAAQLMIYVVQLLLVIFLPIVSSSLVMSPKWSAMISFFNPFVALQTAYMVHTENFGLVGGMDAEWIGSLYSGYPHALGYAGLIVLLLILSIPGLQRRDRSVRM